MKSIPNRLSSNEQRKSGVGVVYDNTSAGLIPAAMLLHTAVSKENRPAACRRNGQVGAAEKIQKTTNKRRVPADPPAPLPMIRKERPNSGINKPIIGTYEIEVKSLIPQEDRIRRGTNN